MAKMKEITYQRIRNTLLTPQKMLCSFVQFCHERLAFLLHNIFTPISIILILFFIYTWKSTKFNTKKNLPPSPPSLPIIGNLHQLGKFPFRSLQSLSEKYGEILLLHLGNKPTIVVSSAEIASRVLKTHDHIFASRPHLSIFRKLLSNGKDVASSPYDEHWRQTRSICMLYLLNKRRVQSYRKVREEEVALMMENIKGLRVANLSDMIVSLTNDVTCRVAFGKKYRGEEGGVDLTKLLEGFIKLLGGFYIGDFISWLAWIDKINGVDAQVNKVVTTFDQFLETVLQDHSASATERHEDEGDTRRIVKDFVDVLLEVQRDDTSENHLLDTESVKGLIKDIFAAGTETTSVLIEWIMSELLRNHRVMQKLQKEVSIITRHKPTVSEYDLENMNYLKAVMKETLRLHPPAPLLLPHESTQDIRINGYDVSAGTQVIVNAWAISRNRKHWEDPESFYPERFLSSSLDFKGQHFQFTPFGSGRRICPGIAFATANIELVIANLVHHYDWSLPDGAAGESLDMTESSGITVRRKIPLLAVPSPRFS